MPDPTLLALLIWLAAAAWRYDQLYLRHKEGSPVMSDVDLDKILEQRQDATGSIDTFPFVYAGERWHCKDPITADDEWKDELSELRYDNEVAEHYLGTEQYKKFIDAGGRAGFVVLAVQQYQRKMMSETDDGRPTRRSTSSRNTRKNSKRT